MQIEYWFALRCSMRALGRGLAPKLRACARIGAGGARGKFTHKRAYFPVWDGGFSAEFLKGHYSSDWYYVDFC